MRAFNPFGYYLCGCRGRVSEAAGGRKRGRVNPDSARKIGFNITEKYLRKIWESQKGICPYSGTPMELRDSSRVSVFNLEAASVDRISSSRGYVRGNVQFVTRAMNMAKGDATHSEFMAFMKEVKNGSV